MSSQNQLRKEQKQEWYQHNKERILEKERNSERKKETQREWYLKNKEDIKRKQKIYRERTFIMKLMKTSGPEERMWYKYEKLRRSINLQRIINKGA